MKQYLKPAYITGIYVLISFVASIIMGFILPDVSTVLPPAALSLRLISGQYYFMQLLPAVLATGFIIGFSLMFGMNSVGALKAFSSQMVKNFHIVLIYGVLFSLLAFCANEIGTMGCMHAIETRELQKRNYNDYLEYTERHLADGDVSQAVYYLRSAWELYPTSPEVASLDRRLEAAQKSVPVVSVEEADSPVVVSLNSVEAQRDSLDYLDASLMAFEDERYIDAHYFATLAASAAEEGDANWSKATQIAAMAWNMLLVPVDTIPEEGKALFSDKMSGYEALARNDIIEAYNIYSQLRSEFPDDQEVATYFDIAREKLESIYFYTDETTDLRTFESAQGVYFRLGNDDGTSAEYHISGITVVEDSSKMIQYLRNLSVITYGADGTLRSILEVPYAKMTAEPVIRGKSKRYEPFLTLVSVDRADSHNRLSPVYTYNPENLPAPSHLQLPMNYSDFNIICKASSGPDSLSVIQLLSFSKKAEDYGYLGESFYVAFLHRVLFPLEMLILLIMLGLSAFRYRLLPGRVFKYKWIFLFPVVTLILFPLFNTVLYFFDVINLVGYNHFGSGFFLVAVLVQMSFLLWTSFLFIGARGE